MSELIDIIFNINNLTATIRMAVPIALAAMGGAFSERSGVVNIGLEGMMLTGAFTGVIACQISGSPWVGVLFAVIGGGLIAAIHAVLTVGLRANHVVAGVGINILASGTTTCFAGHEAQRNSDLVTGLGHGLSLCSGQYLSRNGLGTILLW